MNKELMKVFCDFAGLEDFRQVGKDFRAWYRDSIILFESQGGGKFIPKATRPEYVEEFNTLVASFWKLIEKFEEKEENEQT
jgi:hypothetical protein